ncbi:hypothetical protein ACVU7I_10955 [Patulibacter sp. S7RM1-6]
MLSRRSTVRLAGALVAVGAFAGLGSAAVAGDEKAPALVSPISAAATAKPPIAAVQPEQARTLAIFRRALRPSDAMPADVAAQAASPAKFGRNPGLARAISTPTGKGWVVPGDGVICLVMPDPVEGYGTTCQPTAAVEARGLTLAVAEDAATNAVSVVPDDAAVVATTPEGTRDTLAPDASGVVTLSDEQAEAVTVVTDDGRGTLPLPTADEIATQGGVR